MSDKDASVETGTVALQMSWTVQQINNMSIHPLPPIRGEHIALCAIYLILQGPIAHLINLAPARRQLDLHAVKVEIGSAGEKIPSCVWTAPT